MYIIYSLFISLLFLSGCAEHQIKKLEDIKPQESSFGKVNDKIYNSYHSIKSVKLITKDKFNDLYLSKMLPVKIDNGVKNWKALSLWSPEYLGNILSEKKVEITVSDKNVISYNKNHGSNLRFKQMKMTDAAFLILNNKSLNKKYYITRQPITNYEVLHNDFNIPNWADKNKSYSINMWFGEAGNVTPIHFDGDNNFLVQVFGRKLVKLYSPEDSEFLYPTYGRPGVKNHSQILDIDNPDYVMFPKFKIAKVYDCILYPGDVLFIPSGWWHQVYSLDISISVNFWWPPTIDEYLVSSVNRHNIYNLYKRGELSKINKMLALNQFNNNLDIAKYLNNKHHKWLAILFCMDFLESSLRDFLVKKGDNSLAYKQIKYGEPFFEKNIDIISSTLNINSTDVIEWIDTIKLAKREDDNLLTKTYVEEVLNKISLFTKNLNK